MVKPSLQCIHCTDTISQTFRISKIFKTADHLLPRPRSKIRPTYSPSIVTEITQSSSKSAVALHLYFSSVQIQRSEHRRPCNIKLNPRHPCSLAKIRSSSSGCAYIYAKPVRSTHNPAKTSEHRERENLLQYPAP